MRILVVDAEPAALAALAGPLQGDHEVESCSSGNDALARLERSTYDLLMIDLSMPHPDRFHLLRRSSTLAPGLPGIDRGTLSRKLRAMGLERNPS